MVEERSAGVVLFGEEGNRKKFLLLNYPSGHWDFVKGKIEEGEKPRETAQRETLEETGINEFQFIEGFEEKIQYKYQIQSNLINKEVIFFLGKTNIKKITLSHEHLDYVWLDFNDSLKKITYSNAKRILEKANELIQNS